MSIQRLGVVGAGQMGSGIAQVAAASGRAVTLVDIDESLVARGRATIEKNLTRQVDKGKLTAAQREETLSRVATGVGLEPLAGVDLVVEAIVEDEETKRTLFRRLDDLLPAGAILASNTSSISITRLAAATKRPESVIGMHFMNPVPVMALVEVIRGIATSDDTAARVAVFARELGKTPVECRDFPGFVSNRVLMPMLNEAFFVVHEGVARPEAVDEIMKLGMNHPMGPLTLADFIGLDTCLAILRVLHHGLGEDKYRPCPLLVQMVDAGWNGRKSGRGFYRYAAPGGERLPA
ncbi:MAG: 3-hydroxybutyryl-CoA dehydrogenase [Thermoanaerobaculia bacterium]